MIEILTIIILCIVALVLLCWLGLATWDVIDDRRARWNHMKTTILAHDYAVRQSYAADYLDQRLASGRLLKAYIEHMVKYPLRAIGGNELRTMQYEAEKEPTIRTTT